MLLSQHRVSSCESVRPHAPCGARCMGHTIRTWPKVYSEAPHSQFYQGARPHLCMNEWNRPTPVRRPLSLTQAVSLIRSHSEEVFASYRSGHYAFHYVETQYQPFLDKVDVALLKVTSAESIVLLGDFNAHVGTDCKTWKGVIGKQRYCNINKNGRCLLQFCSTSSFAF